MADAPRTKVSGIAAKIAHGGYIKHRDVALAQIPNQTDEAIRRLVVSIRQGLRLAGFYLP